MTACGSQALTDMLFKEGVMCAAQAGSGGDEAFKVL